MAALRHWCFGGVSENPRVWLTQVARHRALDALRRDAAELGCSDPERRLLERKLERELRLAEGV